MSAVFKLDNCLLWCNPDLYCTISKYFVLLILSLVLLAVDHHLSKSNGFMMSSDLLRSASMESSPFKTVSVKLEIVVQEWRKRLFLFALLTWLGCWWSDLQREPQQHNLPSIFYRNEDGNFCLCCCHHSLLLFHCCLGWCQSIVCVARPASVVCMTHGASFRWLYFYCFLASFLSCILLLFSAFSLQEIWGMNMPNLPKVSRLEDLLVLGCIPCACIAAIDAPLTMIVVAEWVCCDIHNVCMMPL